MKNPLKYTGLLKRYNSFDVTPLIGTEFPDTNVVELMKASNSDNLLRDLAITTSDRGVVFFRAQTLLTDNLQKQLAHRLGVLTGKPESSSLHNHPLCDFNKEEDKNISTVTTDRAKNPAEDRYKNQANRRHGARDLPKTGGDTVFASSCEIYDRISPAYRRFLEGLTITCTQGNYHKILAEKGLCSVGHHFSHVNELMATESARLHDWLLRMVVESDDCQLRHRWRNSYDVAIWDNRSVFHRAIVDFEGIRTARRAVGIGERPYFDPNSKTRREAIAEEGCGSPYAGCFNTQ
ncbi:hypothetical protein BJX96DRAFT_168159 [Aspergillus floccosus]